MSPGLGSRLACLLISSEHKDEWFPRVIHEHTAARGHFDSFMRKKNMSWETEREKLTGESTGGNVGVEFNQSKPLASPNMKYSVKT